MRRRVRPYPISRSRRAIKPNEYPSVNLLELNAGGIHALFDPGNGFLRHIRTGPTEVLRGIYAAVRDHNWDTIEPEIEMLEQTLSPDRAVVAFRARHRAEAIDFIWNGHIEIQATGRIVYRFDGRADSTFLRNRIGFCILHSPDCAGQPATVEKVDGIREETAFPLEIAPHQPMTDLRSIRHCPAPGTAVTVRMEGDTFEMEDQRNWSDASYKTYCTPLGRPFPVQVTVGSTVRQSVTVEVRPRAETAAGPASREKDIPRIYCIDTSRKTRLPEIGLASARKGPLEISPRTLALLGDLRLNHLRVDLHPARRNPQPALRRAARQAESFGARLEVAVHLDRQPERELDRLIRNLCETTDPSAVFRFILFSSETRTTPSLIMNLAREKLPLAFPEAELGGGTDAYFTELNRERPSSDRMDFVSFSINPQVHAFDDLSLVETVPMHGLLVKNAARFTGRPIIVSPVTLKPRFNPNATGPEPEACPGTLPVDVDPRQRLPFTAAWTLGSLKALTESGARSVTFFETVGWRGVIEAAEGNPLPALFPSSPDEVFPVYHLLHALAGWSGAEQVTLKSSRPLMAEALMLKRSGRFLLLIGQSGLEPTEIEVELPDAASPESFRVLSASGDGFAPSPEASTETGRNRFKLWLRSGQIARIEGSLS